MSASTHHADRRGIQAWLSTSIALAAGTCAGTAGLSVVAQHGGEPNLGLLAGFTVGALAVVGLPSISIRLIARSILVVSAALIVRFGALTGSLTSGSQEILAWLLGAVAVFVLTDRIGTDAQPSLGEPVAQHRPLPAAGDRALAQGGTARGEPAGGGTARGEPAGGEPAGGERPAGSLGRAQPARTARVAVLVAAAVLVVAVVLTPLVLPRMSQAASTGQGPRLPGAEDGSPVLRSTESLDMTTRPDLTDEVMFRVTTDRPTFWRGETFDQWDGRRWTRSSDARYAVPGGEVVIDPNDLGAQGTDVFTQQIQMETAFSDVIFGAPSMVSVDTDRLLSQRADGTLTTAQTALGRGARYRVTSRRHPVSEDVLRSAGDEVPEAIAAQYAEVGS